MNEGKSDVLSVADSRFNLHEPNYLPLHRHFSSSARFLGVSTLVTGLPRRRPRLKREVLVPVFVRLSEALSREAMAMAMAKSKQYTDSFAKTPPNNNYRPSLDFFNTFGILDVPLPSVCDTYVHEFLSIVLSRNQKHVGLAFKTLLYAT
jgi:hypothetical protein